MKLIIAILVTICLANAVPLPKESIDLVQIPLKNDKVRQQIYFSKPTESVQFSNIEIVLILKWKF